MSKGLKIKEENALLVYALEYLKVVGLVDNLMYDVDNVLRSFNTHNKFRIEFKIIPLEEHERA